MNEVDAVTIAYKLDYLFEEKNIIVFDLGGSKFSVTILNIDHGVKDVLVANGETYLGG